MLEGWTCLQGESWKKDAGRVRVDTKQRPNFGSVQLSLTPWGTCTMNHTGLGSALTHLSTSPHLCQCSVVGGAWLGWVEGFGAKRHVWTVSGWRKSPSSHNIFDCEEALPCPLGLECWRQSLTQKRHSPRDDCGYTSLALWLSSCLFVFGDYR